MDNLEASQLLKKLLKVDRTDVEPSVPHDNLHDSSISRSNSNTSVSLKTVNGNSVSPYVDTQTSFEQPQRVKQQIFLQGTDAKNSHVVYGQDVEIFISRASCDNQTTTGSSKVKINPVVKYDWEYRRYIGNLIAVHLNRTHVAYVLRAASHNVRVYNRKTAERSLIKGFTGRVVDISFAFTSEVTLGIVDEIGSIFIYDITESADGKITTSLRMQCNRPSGTATSDYHRLIWCDYIPDSAESTSSGSPAEDGSVLFMVTHNNTAEIWNVDVASRPDSVFTLSVADARTGHTVVTDHTQPIVDGAFSPDGVHLATASLDGCVKFYEIIREDDIELRCEQSWQPHGGRPLSCIFFLDDLKHQSSESLWTFLITGAADRHELKIWSTQTWACFQNISFTVPAGMSPAFGLAGGETWLKAGLDLSASYLVLSDISHKVLYILQLHQDHDAGTAHVSSISEFQLAQPILSFALLDAGRRRLVKAQEYGAEHVWSCTTGEVATDDDGDEVPDDVDGTDIGVLVRLYAIHTKAMQELQIRFQPESSVGQAPGSISSASETVSAVRDLLSDLSIMSNESRQRPQSSSSRPGDLSSPVSQTPPQPQHILMTPNAFTSSRLNDDSLHDLPSSVSSSLTLVTALDEDTDMTALHTPHSVKAQTTFGSESEAVKLLPTAVADMFPSSAIAEKPLEIPPFASEIPVLPVVEVPSLSSFSEFDVAGGGCGDDSKLADEMPTDEEGFRHDVSLLPRDQRDSESSAVSSETGAELDNILDSARRSDGLDAADTQGSPSPAYNDEAGGSEEEEGSEERETQDEGDRASGHRNWRTEELQDYDVCEQRVAESARTYERMDDDIGEDFVDKAGSKEGALTLGPRQLSLSGDRKKLGLQQSAFVDTNVVEEMRRSLQQMVTLLEQQQQEIAQLRSEVGRQRALSNNVDRLTLQVDALAATITARVSEILSEKSHIETAQWRHALSDMETRSQRLHVELEQSISRSVEETVKAELEKAVRAEITSSVVPRVAQILEPIKEQLHVELAQKLTATDALLKDNISKLVRSKQTIESLGQATAGALQSSLQSVSRDVLLPSFDRACQNMFQQVSTVFQQGSRDYTQQLESHMEQLRRRRDDARDPVLHQLRALVETLQRREQAYEPAQARLGAAVDTLQKTTAQVSADNEKLETTLLEKLNERQETLMSQLRQIVQHEVSAALRSQQATLTERLELALRSGAATPVPTATDPHQLQQQIASLVRQGKINSAFQQALSATDLSLVMFVCRSFDPSVVFSDRQCPLTQPVLLSLIQQLSANFESDIELKHKYLEEALLQLDQTNPVTREHVANVLRILCSKLNAYVQSSDPKDKLFHPMKKLLSICDIYLRGCAR